MLGGRRKQNAPHPGVLCVGARVRERRITLGMSQPKLAAVLGIAYQQLYKYEQAKKRISPTRLYELSKVLGVPITFFFESIGETDEGAGADVRDDETTLDRLRDPNPPPPS